MAKKFSELPAASTLTGTEIVPVVQGGVTKQTTLGALPISTAMQTGLDAKFDKTGGQINGGVEIVGTGRRIKGDFSNATMLSRTMFQTSVLNSVTSVGYLPNGTGVTSGFNLFMSSDPDNTSMGQFIADGTLGVVRLASGARGSGTYSPMSFETGGTERLRIETTAGHITPGSDNTQNIGSVALRIKEFFCANATINTSDAREKTPVRKLTTAELAAARDLLAEIGIYQFLAAVAEKGADTARLHEGITVQRAIEVMESHGLDPMRYGFICYDQWPETVEEVEDDAGDLVRIVQRQAMRETVSTVQAVEIIDGTPTLVERQHTERTPVFEYRKVVTADGEPVADDDGEPIMHPVPVMEGVEQRYRRVVTPAGDRYSFRETRLIMFILAGLV